MSLPLHLIKSQMLQLLENSTPEDRNVLVAELRHEGWLLTIQKVAPYSGLRWIKSRLLLKQWTKTLLQLRENAKNQIAILDAFEKKKWQTTISYLWTTNA
jgi:hypothetical protein